MTSCCADLRRIGPFFEKLPPSDQDEWFTLDADLDHGGMSRRVAYYYDSDVGAYTYGPHHYMKPHRIRMAHHLVAAYGMLPKMQVIVSGRLSCLLDIILNDQLSSSLIETTEVLSRGND
jgi:hypothetical protein